MNVADVNTYVGFFHESCKGGYSIKQVFDDMATLGKESRRVQE